MKTLFNKKTISAWMFFGFAGVFAMVLGMSDYSLRGMIQAEAGFTCLIFLFMALAYDSGMKHGYEESLKVKK